MTHSPEGFDILLGYDPDNKCAVLYCHKDAQAFLMAQGFAPDQKLWQPCDDRPGWFVVPFGGPDGFKRTHEVTGVVEYLRPLAFVRYLGHAIAERCRENGITIRVGLMLGDATVEPL